MKQFQLNKSSFWHRINRISIKYDICSPFGQKKLLNNKINHINSCDSFEQFCLTETNSNFTKSNFQINQSERITRANNNGLEIELFKRTEFIHLYSFTSSQRKERFKQIQTGLNRRARILFKKCNQNKVNVKVIRLVCCPLCGQQLDDGQHKCDKIDLIMRKQKITIKETQKHKQITKTKKRKIQKNFVNKKCKKLPQKLPQKPKRQQRSQEKVNFNFAAKAPCLT